jgi:hypothetical protein
MMAKQEEMQKEALAALQHMIPLLKKFKWVITGGFACYVYGVQRPITDIDIDIDTRKDDPQFQSLLASLEPYQSQPLEHFVDKNYDNYSFEATFGEQVVDICPMAELKIFNQSSRSYELFYSEGFPATELISFFGFELPLLSKELIIKNKEMLVWQRDSDRSDIKGLRAKISL